MTSTSTERHSLISHTIGAKGRFVLRTVRGSVRVRGVDGDEVVVEVRYPGAGTGDPEEDGVLRVARADDLLQIDVDESDDRGSKLARLFGNGRPRVDFEVTMPRSATLRLNGVSADVEVMSLTGKTELRTVSGDMRVVDVEGSLDLQAVSGDATVSAGDVTLRATTTSGDLTVEGGTLYNLQIKTVSGDVRIIGRLDAASPHSLETISGDVDLAPANGVSITMSSISGSIHSAGLGRVDQSRGRGSLVVGDGAARLNFRTMSGDLNVRGAQQPRAELPTAAADAPAAATPAALSGRDSRSAFPDLPAIPELPALPRLPALPALPAAPRPPVPPSPPAPSSLEPRSTPAPSAQMDVLQALERGEIDVTTAARLLEEQRNA